MPGEMTRIVSISRLIWRILRGKWEITGMIESSLLFRSRLLIIHLLRNKSEFLLSARAIAATVQWRIWWPTNRVAPLDRGKRQRWNGTAWAPGRALSTTLPLIRRRGIGILGLVQCLLASRRLVRLSLGNARLGLSGR